MTRTIAAGAHTWHVSSSQEPVSVDQLEQVAALASHRAPSIPDLLVSPTAELAELTLLHLHKDFELVAQITGQSAERLKIE